MRNIVYVGLKDGIVSVENEFFQIENLSADLIKNYLPENIEPTDIGGIYWCLNDPAQTVFNTYHNGDFRFDVAEENYNKFIKPYVDIWQVEKDRIEQEQQEIEEEYNHFENRQSRALNQLNRDFTTAAERAHVKSSLGFTADANSTANENVNGLLITIGDGTVQFCDYYNQFHELNKTQLETLQSEIIQNGQNLYAQKWQYRTAIESCGDNDQLDSVVSSIQFTYLDFSASA